MKLLPVAAVTLTLAAGCGGYVPPAPAGELPAGVAATGYHREAFGSGWADLNGDGCDTRDEVLAEWAVTLTLDQDGCAAEVTITDPYTLAPVTGRGNIDVDHVVSLADAWRSGASAWAAEERERFANDPTNLLPTADEVNAAKGDRGPDRWRPPARSGWCWYGTIYRHVKDTYELRITTAQAAAVGELTAGCQWAPRP